MGATWTLTLTIPKISRISLRSSTTGCAQHPSPDQGDLRNPCSRVGELQRSLAAARSPTAFILQRELHTFVIFGFAWCFAIKLLQSPRHCSRTTGRALYAHQKVVSSPRAYHAEEVSCQELGRRSSSQPFLSPLGFGSDTASPAPRPFCGVILVRLAARVGSPPGFLRHVAGVA